MQRRQTKAFINAAPSTVILSRAGFTSNGAGGRIQGAPSPLPSQTVRLLIPSANYGQGERQLLDGQVVQVDYIMLCEWDADVERGDWFYKDGEKFEVVSVRTVGDYEKKAEITNRG